MLKPDAAKKQLAQWMIERDEELDDDEVLEDLLPPVKKLPKKLRDIGYALLGRNANGEESDDWEKSNAYCDQQMERLDDLPARDRLRLFRTFFGTLADDMEVTWQWMKSAPYSSGYTTLPFRAPQSPEVTRDGRGEWLRKMIPLAAGFQPNVLTPAWLAAWVPHIQLYGWQTYEDIVPMLLAATIDAGGKTGNEVFEVLRQSALKEHEIGAMGRHVSQALLAASRPEGWELMEKMLLAAQRQEGLRQVILESAAGAHPKAFRRLLQLIKDENLARFSSVVRAMDEWFGMAWAAAGAKKVHDTVATMVDLLGQPAKCKKALSGTDAETAYLALWATAHVDAAASIPPAARLVKHKQVEMRFVGSLHLSRLGIPAAQPPRVKALDDEDIRVALTALRGVEVEEFEAGELAGGKELFEALERLLARMPAKPTKLKSLVWPWTEDTARRGEVSEKLLDARGDLPPLRLIPHMKAFDTFDRCVVVRQLAEQKKWDRQTRETILALVGDASADVREDAIAALAKAKITPGDVATLEGYLTRTAADLRKGVVGLLLAMTDKDALASAARLLDSKNKNQRLAGLEILRQMAVADRRRSTCIQVAGAWRDARKKTLKDEQSQLDAILDSEREVFTLDDALGLMDPAKRSQASQPKKFNVVCVTATIPKLLKSLDDLVHQHREETISYKEWNGKPAEAPLGEINYHFPAPNHRRPAAQLKEKLPLHDVWEDWHRRRPASFKDKDGLELLRAHVFTTLVEDWDYGDMKDWLRGNAARKPIGDLVRGTIKTPRLKYEAVVDDLLQWLLVLHPPKEGIDFCLNVIETAVAMIPDKDLEDLKKTESKDDDDFDESSDWREHVGLSAWKSTLEMLFEMPALKPTKKQRTRYWRLLRWLDEPVPGARRSRPDLEEATKAYIAGDATLADITDCLLGPHDASCWSTEFSELSDFTSRRPPKYLREFMTRPEIDQLVRRCTERVLEIELARGEAATPATEAAISVRSYRGMDTLMNLLSALGKGGFKKNTSWRSKTEDSRAATFTEMVASTYPDEDDSAEQFASAMRQAIKRDEFPEERLLQLAFLAPQWTEFVEATLKWDGLAEGQYWFMAHMGHGEMEFGDEDDEDDDDDGDESTEEQGPAKLSHWERIIHERTPLTEEERRNGAIDVAWFHRTYNRLKPKRWEQLAEAAKFAASGAARKRAQLITDVLLGKTTGKELVDGIRKRNLKENVRLLGLLPLATGTGRDKDVVDRYQVLQEYRRYANKLSSMTRPEALRACEIGLQNLAATAGYADPMRLQWAMEAESTKDLTKGPVVVKKGDVSLTLSLDDRAQVELTVRRGDKVLKSLPKTVNKDKLFVELRERHTHLKRQASRVRHSLETAMFRGDTFTGAELWQLADHAILWPQLERLILVGEGILGYPVKRGKALSDHAGKFEPVKKNEQLRVAHPYDLLQSKAWNKWQHECFAAERLQPFKQVFRELYVVTRQEKKDKTFSNRYAGQQVNPRQAHALWGSRGWSVDEYDNVFKAYHDEAINVAVSFDHGITTPLEVEGLTIDQVSFSRRNEYKPLALPQVPPRIFSEAMRDMDLVVSVAHAGEVDPEASASTVEMRANLLRETCQLLNLKNVKLRESRALIKGQLGEYTVHLGSGVVHRLPGGSVCIVPVHSQHRGRLFLPFADDDPRTAEVVSKTLLLARDDEIDDPIILEQLRNFE